MDLLEFSAEDLYYAGEQPREIESLLEDASQAYGSGDAEYLLLKAFFLAPEDLSVLVALYRYFYYQHRYEDALIVAHRAMDVSGARLGINADWTELGAHDLGYGAQASMSLMRFYLYALKGAGYLKLRLGDIDGAVLRLNKVVELDKVDRIGAKGLLDVVHQAALEADAAKTAQA